MFSVIVFFSSRDNFALDPKGNSKLNGAQAGDQQQQRVEANRIRDDLIRGGGGNDHLLLAKAAAAASNMAAAAANNMGAAGTASNGGVNATGAGGVVGGIAPSGWIQSPAHAAAMAAAAAGVGGHSSTSSLNPRTIVVALYTYQGSEFGDMSFAKGDMMEILDKA